MSTLRLFSKFRLFNSKLIQSKSHVRSFSSLISKNRSLPILPLIYSSTALFGIYYWWQCRRRPALCYGEGPVFGERAVVPRRLKRFLNFASVEYNGVVYMTPQDLLDSLILDEPRERVFRTVLTKDHVEKMLRSTPPLSKSDKKMFRHLAQRGIISYAEYLFLLTLLTKSQSSFKIAFSIFDDDENQRIDKNEFMKIRSLILFSRVDAEEQEARDAMDHDLQFEQLTAQTAGALQNPAEMEDASELVTQDTTILIHLFGRNGRNTLTFDQFQQFYNNLQAELIEIEFNEFARGKADITAMDFARLVFRYTLLPVEKQTVYVGRLASRLQADPNASAITLAQFEQFSRFLNNLEDFTRAVRLYTNADIPVSQSEFIRAVKCSTGLELDAVLVDVLFKIFDANGDGQLSYSEFIDVMNDRLNRGLKNRISKGNARGWKVFRDCVIREVAAS